MFFRHLIEFLRLAVASHGKHYHVPERTTFGTSNEILLLLCCDKIQKEGHYLLKLNDLRISIYLALGLYNLLEWTNTHHNLFAECRLDYLTTRNPCSPITPGLTRAV